MNEREHHSASPGLGGAAAVRFRIVGGYPSITQAPFVGDTFRKAVLSRAGAVLGYYNIPPIISGKGEFQSVPRMAHRHAYYLCEPELGYGCITHLCMYVPEEINPALFPLLASIEKLWSRDIGDMLVEPDEDDPYEYSRLLSRAKEWISITPFMLGKHPRIRRSERHSRKDYNAALERELELQVRGELARMDFPEPVEVEFDRKMGVQLGRRFLRWDEFKRVRPGESPGPAVRYGHGFRLLFRKPVRGPIVIGYGCHFGLGLFLPSRLLKAYRE